MNISVTTRLLGAAVIALASLGAHAAPNTNPTALLGANVPANQASRSIPITSKTPYVNVRYGDVVRFDANGHSFAVKFDGVRDTFDLNLFAPAGALDHVVRVYVEPVDDYPL